MFAEKHGFFASRGLYQVSWGPTQAKGYTTRKRVTLYEDSHINIINVYNLRQWFLTMLLQNTGVL